MLCRPGVGTVAACPDAPANPGGRTGRGTAVQLTQYGPGDAATWGPCLGHPCDPRSDDELDESFADAVFDEAVDGGRVHAMLIESGACTQADLDAIEHYSESEFRAWVQQHREEVTGWIDYYGAAVRFGVL